MTVNQAMTTIRNENVRNYSVRVSFYIHGNQTVAANSVTSNKLVIAINAPPKSMPSDRDTSDRAVNGNPYLNWSKCEFPIHITSS